MLKLGVTWVGVKGHVGQYQGHGGQGQSKGHDNSRQAHVNFKLLYLIICRSEFLMFTERSSNNFRCTQDLTGNMSHQNPGHGHIRKREMPSWESAHTDTQNQPPSRAHVTSNSTGGQVQHAGGQVMIDFSGGASSHTRPPSTRHPGQPAVAHPPRNQSAHPSRNFDTQPSRKRQSSGTATEAPAQKAVRPSGTSQAAASTSQDMRSPGSSTGMKVRKYVFFYSNQIHIVAI